MTGKIRLGLLGASVSGRWFSWAHFPALKARFRADCGLRDDAQSAEAARKAKRGRGSRFNVAPPGTPAGEAINIGPSYAAFAGAIRSGSSNHPAMAMHRVIDAMRQASDTAREVRLALAQASSGAACR